MANPTAPAPQPPMNLINYLVTFNAPVTLRGQTPTTTLYLALDPAVVVADFVAQQHPGCSIKSIQRLT
jgi:hypothetical protein